jgi:hypothetical protein
MQKEILTRLRTQSIKLTLEDILAIADYLEIALPIAKRIKDDIPEYQEDRSDN